MRRPISLLVVFCIAAALLPSQGWAQSPQSSRATSLDSPSSRASTTSINQIDGFTAIDTLDGNTYYVSDTTMTWSDAEAAAEQEGGYLATITSQEESDLLSSYVVNQGEATVWIGFTDRETEGDWKWVTGEEVTFTNWDESEPNNAGNGEDRAVIWAGNPTTSTPGSWNDYSNSKNFRFILEKPSFYAPANPTTTAGDGNIELNWEATNTESALSGYNVYRDTSSFNDISNATKVNASLISDTSYIDSGLSNGTAYYYRVTAVDSAGNESSPTSEVGATPRGEGKVIYAEDFSSDPGYQVLYSDNTSGEAEVYWDDTNENYYAKVKDQSAEWWSLGKSPVFPSVDSSEAFTISFTFNPLETDWGHYPGIYFISSDSSSGPRKSDTLLKFDIASSDSYDKQFRLTSENRYSTPTIPAEDEWYDVTVDYDPEAGTIDLRILRANGSTFVDETGIAMPMSGTFDQIMIGETQGNTKYGDRAQIRVNDIVVEKGKEHTSSPATPTNLSETAGDQSVDLTWSPESNTTNLDYNVYRGTTSFSDVSNATKVNASLISDTSYTDSGLTNGTTYYYRVTAVDSDGSESSPSSEVSATPSSGGGGENTLDVGGVTIYADEITNTSGSVYEASGNVSVNQILNLEGTVTADTEALSIKGNNEIYLTDIPDLSRVSLYNGEYTFSLADQTSSLLNGEVLDAENSQLNAAGLDVHLDEIELLSDGVRVGGELKFPGVLGGIEPQVSTLQITESDGLDFTGNIEVENVGLKGGIAELKNLSLTYASAENQFEGDAKLVTTPFSLNAGTRVIGGQVDSVGVDIEVSPPVPIANTGFGLVGGGGSISGLVGSPTRLSVNADVTPLTGNTEVVTLADLALAYRFDTKITGSGRVEIFEQSVGGASLTVSSKKVAFEGRVGLSVPDTESNVLGGQLNAGVSRTPTDNLEMNGGLIASLQIPNLGTGFPYGWLSGGLGLPYEVAQTDNTLSAKPLDGTGRFTGETVVGVGEADFTEHRVAYGVAYSGGELSSSFADNMENLNEELFPKSALVTKKAARRENRFEGQSLIVGASNSNPLLSKRADSLQQAFTLQEESSSLIIRVQSDAVQPSFTVTTPSGRTLSGENTSGVSTASYTETSDQNKSFYSIEAPSTGEWIVNLPDDGTEYAVDVIGASPAPSLDLDAPNKSESTVALSWQANDPDDEATVDLYYDTDRNGQDGVPIAQNLSEDRTSYSWDVSNLPTGTYYVYAKASDGKNAPTVMYAQEPVQVVAKGAPSAPENLSTVAQDSSLVVSWQAVDGADRYTVYYEEGSDPSFEQSARAGVGDTTQVALDRIAAGRTYHLAVTASDTAGNESSLSDVATASYTSQTTNNAPLIATTNPDGIAREGKTYTQQIDASDADDDPLNYGIVSGPDGMTIGTDGQLSWDPVPGSYRIKVRVTDGNGGADSLSYSLRALDRESATARVAFSQSTYVGYESLGQVTITDPDLNKRATAIDSQEVRIRSGEVPKGITTQLRETQTNSGQFRASFEFGTQTSGGNTLNVAPSDTMVITYQDSYPDTSITATARFLEEEPPKVAPDLKAPADSAYRITTHPALKWTSLDASDQYRLQVATDSNFDVIVSEQVTTDSSLVLHNLKKATTYVWRVRAENVQNGPWSAPKQFTTRAAEVQVVAERSFDGADEPADYQLVALPGAVDRPLEQTLSGEAGAEWQAYWDDGSSDGYLRRFDSSNTFQFLPGRGFWLTSKQNWSVDDSIKTVDLKESSRFGIELHDGWNIIANPLERDVSWQTVEAANGDTLEALWRFDSGFERTDTLKSASSGSAYYFLNDRGLDSLSIPYPRVGSSKTAAVQEREEEQTLVLEAEQGPRRSKVYLGIQQDANEGFGPRDVVAPPSRFSALSLRLEAPESAPKRRRLLVEEHRPAVQDGQTFRLLLQAKPGAPVRFDAENLSAMNEKAIALLRPGADQSYDLRTEQTITLQSPDSTILQLAVGTESYVERKRKEVLPDKVQLTSYPNPARHGGIIEYTLPEKADVTLRLYDILGREVATLQQGRKEAGRHTVQLETDQLSSGVYFGRLTAGDRTLTQKITVVR